MTTSRVTRQDVRTGLAPAPPPVFGAHRPRSSSRSTHRRHRGAGEEDEEPVEEEPDSAGEASEDEGAIPMDALSDDYVLHPDAMPKQKVEIDNKVCVMLFLNMSWCFLDAVYRSPWSAYAAPLHSIRHFPGRKL